MRRLFRWCLIGTVILLIAGIVLGLQCSRILSAAIRKGVETIGPKATGGSVTLDRVDLSILTGAGTLRGFVVGNPPGFKTKDAMRVDAIHVDVDVSSVLSNVIVIEEIRVTGAEVTYEIGAGTSNISTLQKNIEEFVNATLPKGGAPAGSESPAPSNTTGGGDAGGGKKVIIRHFYFEDGKVRLSAALLQGKALALPIPDLHLTGIGEKTNGETIGEAIRQLTRPVFDGIAKILSKSTELLKDAGVNLKDLGGDLKNFGGNLKDMGKGTVDNIKGLFGK